MDFSTALNRPHYGDRSGIIGEKRWQSPSCSRWIFLFHILLATYMKFCSFDNPCCWELNVRRKFKREHRASLARGDPPEAVPLPLLYFRFRRSRDALARLSSISLIQEASTPLLSRVEILELFIVRDFSLQLRAILFGFRRPVEPLNHPVYILVFFISLSLFYFYGCSCFFCYISRKPISEDRKSEQAQVPQVSWVLTIAATISTEGTIDCVAISMGSARTTKVRGFS